MRNAKLSDSLPHFQQVKYNLRHFATAKRALACLPTFLSAFVGCSLEREGRPPRAQEECGEDVLRERGRGGGLPGLGLRGGHVGQGRLPRLPNAQLAKRMSAHAHTAHFHNFGPCESGVPSLLQKELRCWPWEQPLPTIVKTEVGCFLSLSAVNLVVFHCCAGQRFPGQHTLNYAKATHFAPGKVRVLPLCCHL